jgi:putative FmdB family regulatory protein
MPIYCFECTQCHAIFEVQATFKEKEAGLEPECPHCKGRQARQIISGGLIIRNLEGVSISGLACNPKDGPGCCG